MTSGVLAFRNEVQKSLFEIELQGQISDGMWENATPHDHYKPWCNATVIVDPTNVGRGFGARRDYYGFSSPRLLEVVGGRMLAYARLTLKFGGSVAQTLSDLYVIDDSTGAANMPSDDRCAMDSYYANKKEKLEVVLSTLGITIEELNWVCTDTSVFSMKQLRRELLDMSKICRIYRQTGI